MGHLIIRMFSPHMLIEHQLYNRLVLGITKVDERVLVPQNLMGEIAHKPVMVAKKKCDGLGPHHKKRGISSAQEVLGSNCDE